MQIISIKKSSYHFKYHEFHKNMIENLIKLTKALFSNKTIK